MKTKSGSITFEKLLSPENGEKVKELNSIISTEEFISENPDVFTEEEKSGKLEEISNYRQEMNEFWKAAKENKGNLGNMVFRGGSKKQRTEVDSRKIQNAINHCGEKIGWNKKSHSRPLGYGACGYAVTWIYPGFTRTMDYQSLVQKIFAIQKRCTISTASQKRSQAL